MLKRQPGARPQCFGERVAEGAGVGAVQEQVAGLATVGTMAIGYDHGSTLIATDCNACHEAGSNLVGTA